MYIIMYTYGNRRVIGFIQRKQSACRKENIKKTQVDE